MCNYNFPNNSVKSYKYSLLHEQAFKTSDNGTIIVFFELLYYK